ncbi:unnamed protein product, partial [Didymodactylos carnosus]
FAFTDDLGFSSLDNEEGEEEEEEEDGIGNFIVFE